MQQNKTKITANSKLALIVQSVMEVYPICYINKSVEMLIARGSKDYLDEIGLTIQDLEDIKISKQQIEEDNSCRVANTKELLSEL